MLEVTVLGGGVAAAKLCDALADHGGLDRPLRIRLAARRAERVEGIARHASERVGRRRPAWRVAASPTVTDAIRGADIILNLVRVGGLAARAWDEHFPEAFGQVGDEGLGLGGVANAWRSLPVMDRLAGTIAREAPDALVLNMAAPLGVTTRCFLEAGVRTFGLCELPGLTRDRWRRLLPTGGNAALHYCGLNHLGWFWPADAAGAAILDSAVRAGEVDGEILERFGAAPLHYYATLFDTAAAARLRSTRRPGRARELADLSEVIFASMIAQPGGEIPQIAARPTPWFDRVVAPVIDAVAGPGRFSDFLNLPNDGAWLAGSPAGIVVEVPADIAGGQVGRQPQPPPPRPVSEFLLACAQSEDLNYRAAAARDRRMLVRAIAALPTSLPAARMDEIVARIIAGERFAETPDPQEPPAS